METIKNMLIFIRYEINIFHKLIITFLFYYYSFCLFLTYILSTFIKYHINNTINSWNRIYNYFYVVPFNVHNCVVFYKSSYTSGSGLSSTSADVSCVWNLSLGIMHSSGVPMFSISYETDSYEDLLELSLKGV